MKMILPILMFVASNLIGFFSLSICLFSLLATGIITEDFLSREGAFNLQNWSASIMIIWIICALFSIAALFMKKKERFILLAAPAVVPVIYGFGALFIAASSSF